VDKVMQDAVNEFNKKMAGIRADERTIVKFMSYDAKVPTLGYFYSSAHYLSTGRKTLTESEKIALRQFHVQKTCSSKFDIFMKHYGLEVIHSFEDATTGKNLVEMKIRYSDCV
jgi:hypothetical protein